MNVQRLKTSDLTVHFVGCCFFCSVFLLFAFEIRIEVSTRATTTTHHIWSEIIRHGIVIPQFSKKRWWILLRRLMVFQVYNQVYPFRFNSLRLGRGSVQLISQSHFFTLPGDPVYKSYNLRNVINFGHWIGCILKIPIMNMIIDLK